MAKKKHIRNEKAEENRDDVTQLKLPVQSWVVALGGYIIIALTLTFPLILRMNSSVYGFYDHISTDLFASIHYNFWMLKHALIDLKSSPLVTPLFAAPFGSRVNFVNFTGFVQLPITIIFGFLFSRNFTILCNLIVSAFGMYLLVKHVTKNAAAGFIAGIAFAFCPNMMVRSYTTFDSTQVQWIPLYTLFVLRFIEDRTWLNALLSGLFLSCTILFAIPYYLVFLPVHTVVLLAVYAAYRIWADKRGFGGFVADLTSKAALKGWMKIAVALAGVIVVFGVYYTVFVGGAEYTSSVQRTTEDLSQLALKPTDYLMPHPRSALLKGNVKKSYWNTKRPGKDPDSFVAYVGYIVIALAALGAVKGRKSVYKWVFAAGAIVALWSTLGPTLFGLPTPSGLIHSLYAPFARRILIYKVFVQMGLAGLAGMGAAVIFERVKRVKRVKSAKQNSYSVILGLMAFFMIAEYAIVPPALSVNLSTNPPIYEKIKSLPDDTTIIELPMRRSSSKLYQGYVYYQTYHNKNLFNPYFSLSLVPERIRPLYTALEAPLEAQSYANLAALRWLGVTHLTYHWYIGTKTVRFASFQAPGFATDGDKGLVRSNIDGLTPVYTCPPEKMREEYTSPFDYTFADLYEITAEPSPILLSFDYHSPFEQVPGLMERDFPVEYGWASAFIDSTCSYYYPVAEKSRLVRLLRQGGKIAVTNMSDEAVECSVTFTARSADEGREINAKWKYDLNVVGIYEIGTIPTECTVKNLKLRPAETAELSIWSTEEAYKYSLELGGKSVSFPVTAVLYDFRVDMK